MKPILYTMLINLLCITRSIRLLKSAVNPSGISHSRLSSMMTEDNQIKRNGDILITALNDQQDISIKVVSCRELIQETIIRHDSSPQAATVLGETIVCGLMMGSSLKGEETLQINLVGDRGIKNVIVITDGELNVKSRIGEPKFSYGKGDTIRTSDILGDGQVQIVRNHPSWKYPTNGIVSLRDTSVPLNLALYMVESEQRSAAIITDVKVDGNLCRYALGVMIERLPGATDENLEKSIQNLGRVEQKGLRSYLDRNEEEKKQDENLFRDFTYPLDRIIDDCLHSMSDESIRWSKYPKLTCSCGMDRIWRALRLLPKEEIQSMIEQDEVVSMKCEFCGKNYEVTKLEVMENILNVAA